MNKKRKFHYSKKSRCKNTCDKYDLIRRKKFNRKWQSEHNGSLKEIKDVPIGCYCYKTLRMKKLKDGSLKFESVTCPYWYSIEIPEEELDDHVGIVAVGQHYIGGCKYTNETDDDRDSWGLYWDMVKECNIP